MFFSPLIAVMLQKCWLFKNNALSLGRYFLKSYFFNAPKLKKDGSTKSQDTPTGGLRILKKGS
jgi:hypothetical protein